MKNILVVIVSSFFFLASFTPYHNYSRGYGMMGDFMFNGFFGLGFVLNVIIKILIIIALILVIINLYNKNRKDKNK